MTNQNVRYDSPYNREERPSEYSMQNPYKFAELAPDDRFQRYQQYLHQQPVPKKDQALYLSTNDIAGAQPRRLNDAKGKKRLGNFNADVYTANHEVILN